MVGPRQSGTDTGQAILQVDAHHKGPGHLSSSLTHAHVQSLLLQYHVILII